VRVNDCAGTCQARADYDALEEREGREKCQIGLIDRHLDERFVWDLATHPAIIDAVEAVMGPDVMLLATHFFCKYPTPADGRERFVAWHQDITYWGLEPPFALTAWYAVDDADQGNGCMRVIPGTHHGIRDHGKAQKDGNLLSINQEAFVTEEDEARAVDLCLRAGEITLHHGTLVHGSNANRSNRRRCGLTVRFVPPHVKHVAENSLRRPWQAILVRGEDRFGNFGRLESPFPLRS
jgi:ectoine hydroxylase-related dioxygenase (phytanoyl-CoA dioxygenase family)